MSFSTMAGRRVTMVCILVLLFSHLRAGAQRSNTLDDVLRWVPLSTTVALKAAGVPSADSWRDFAVKGGMSIAICCGTTVLLKNVVHSSRPDGTGDDSFPSGHSSFAFAGATILHREYGHISPWISVGGYAVATFTAVDRVLRDRHHWLDVGAGAVIGVAATELGYFLGDKLTKALFPRRSGALALSLAPASVSIAITL